jgi:hypothetical protein
MFVYKVFLFRVAAKKEKAEAKVFTADMTGFIHRNITDFKFEALL